MLVFSFFFFLTVQVGYRFQPGQNQTEEPAEKASTAWFLKREKLSAARVRAIFVGDIMLSRKIGKLMAEKNDYEFPFRRVQNYLRPYDIVFGNLEGPISQRGKNQGSKYSFRADPKAVAGLRSAGFNVLSVANNHIWDWGKEALADTLAILKNNGILPVGAGLDYQEANRVKIKEIKGRQFGFLAFTSLYPKSLSAGAGWPGVSDFNLPKIVEQIRSVKAAGQVDFLIVSLHWGEEYRLQANRFQKETARQLIDAGADLIIGHHPHVREEVERYSTGWIFYSLGNFVFDQGFSRETMTGLAAEVIFGKGKILEVKPVKVELNEFYQPAMNRESRVKK